MMYKLILVASAVNAAEHENTAIDHAKHETTATLVRNLCGLVGMMPDAVPMGVVKLLKDYGPVAISTHFRSVKDTKLANQMVLKGCECFDDDDATPWDCFLKEIKLLKKEGAQLITEKAIEVAFDSNSVVAQTAGKAVHTYMEGELENPVQRAKAFVDFIVDAEEDNATMSFKNIMGETEADNLTEKLKMAQAELKKAVEVEKRESFSCTEDLYLHLKDIVKDGLYDEVLARSNDMLGAGEDDNSLTSLFKKVAVRTGVSHTISFLDTCNTTTTTAAPDRILLA